MKPIFTIHAGEYLVGEEIERRFKNLCVWVPAKDIGVDLLVTNKARPKQKPISIQVKFSKDFHATSPRNDGNKSLEAGGWWNFKKEKINKSPADLWILVLYDINTKNHHFIIIPPGILLDQYCKIFPGKDSVVRSYLWVTKAKDGEFRCWEARSLKKNEQEKILMNPSDCSHRSFDKYLENWDAFEALDKIKF